MRKNTETIPVPLSGGISVDTSVDQAPIRDTNNTEMAPDGSGSRPRRGSAIHARYNPAQTNPVTAGRVQVLIETHPANMTKSGTWIIMAIDTSAGQNKIIALHPVRPKIQELDTTSAREYNWKHTTVHTEPSMSNHLEYTIARKGDLTVPETVTYRCVEASATEPENYTLPYAGTSGTVTFASGDVEQSIKIPIVAIADQAKYFYIDLLSTSTSSGHIGPNSRCTAIISQTYMVIASGKTEQAWIDDDHFELQSVPVLFLPAAYVGGGSCMLLSPSWVGNAHAPVDIADCDVPVKRLRWRHIALVSAFLATVNPET